MDKSCSRAADIKKTLTYTCNLKLQQVILYTGCFRWQWEVRFGMSNTSRNFVFRIQGKTTILELQNSRVPPKIQAYFVSASLNMYAESFYHRQKLQLHWCVFTYGSYKNNACLYIYNLVILIFSNLFWSIVFMMDLCSIVGFQFLGFHLAWKHWTLLTNAGPTENSPSTLRWKTA